MKLTFWGTRGSLPTPLDAVSVRVKIANALVKADGRAILDAAAAQRFIDEELTFAEWGSFGGNSACIEIETDTAEYLLCDLGSGARPLKRLVRLSYGKRRQGHRLLHRFGAQAG
jgi:hypothetical protein